MAGSPAQAKTDRADVDVKSMTPLCTFPFDEQYIMNKLWLNGVSSIILDGVGDGMVVWCALQKRIQIMCLYDREVHKKTIEEFLQEKIRKKMEEATPRDTRWYRTAAVLGCREGEEAAAKKPAAAKAKGLAAVPLAAVAVAAPKAKASAGVKRGGEDEDEEESSSSSDSPSEKAPKKKPKKAEPVEEEVEKVD